MLFLFTTIINTNNYINNSIIYKKNFIIQFNIKVNIIIINKNIIKK